MYICIYKTCVYIYIYIYIYISIYLSLSLSLYIYIYISAFCPTAEEALSVSFKAPKSGGT